MSERLVRIVVNGEPREAEVEAHRTLQRALLFKPGLTGSAKTFCDHGECGACTVIVDGRPVPACVTLAVECDNTSIETIEGIAASGHPLIHVYMKRDAMQCGYCSPGFIVTAKALLDRNPDPTEEEIRQALSGNLCRCGTYPRHTRAWGAASRSTPRTRPRRWSPSVRP